MSKRQREKDEREMANNCIQIIGSLISQQIGWELKERKDKQSYIEFIKLDADGKKTPFMRVDVLCRIFEDES